MSACRPRVLVVDDEDQVRDLLSDLLALWGCEADTAATGRDGLDLFARTPYDLVVTDHMMPGVTGLDMVRTIRDRDRHVGIIMLTASREVDGHPERLGFTLVRKPVSIGGLEQAVREALDQAGR
jgi:DNA-binding response OmpR family regulator